jgi:hypothetical protein
MAIAHGQEAGALPATAFQYKPPVGSPVGIPMTSLWRATPELVLACAAAAQTVIPWTSQDEPPKNGALKGWILFT